MGVSDSAQRLWCRAAWDSPGSVSAAAQLYPTHMKDGGKHSQSVTLAEAMAASALSRTATNNASSSSQRRGHREASDTSDTKDVGRNTVQEKTLEFFQICDMENKGFITRRDMQVRF